MQCTNCKKPLLTVFQRLNYYSDYSQEVACPHCGVSDHHFIKPLSACFQLQLAPGPGPRPGPRVGSP